MNDFDVEEIECWEVVWTHGDCFIVRNDSSFRFIPYDKDKPIITEDYRNHRGWISDPPTNDPEEWWHNLHSTYELAMQAMTLQKKYFQEVSECEDCNEAIARWIIDTQPVYDGWVAVPKSCRSLFHCSKSGYAEVLKMFGYWRVEQSEYDNWKFNKIVLSYMDKSSSVYDPYRIGDKIYDPYEIWREE